MSSPLVSSIYINDSTSTFHVFFVGPYKYDIYIIMGTYRGSHQLLLL